MSSALPLDLAIHLISELELISWHKSNVILIWEYEVCHLFLIDAPVPPDLNIGLSLRFFELFVVICFKPDQRFKNFFVLFWVFITQENWLLKFFKHNMVEVIKRGGCICLPEVL